ncbi:YdeI/OmpD-associated family protein [Myxococcota bacterium]|nr:YdeI/OmpD-associated family protein [Myxococcota bacterium]
MAKPKTTKATTAGREPVYFEDVRALRAWLARHHATAEELWLGLVKKGATVKGVAYPEALDEALCFGWIDGVRKSVDDERWFIRFTPRKATSYWSEVNLARFDVLAAAGRVTAAGRAAWERRATASDRYSYEANTEGLAPEWRARFAEEHPEAWARFEVMAPYYRRVAGFWVMSAKGDATKARRFQTLVDCSARGEKVPPLAPSVPASKKATAKKTTAKKATAKKARAR